MDIIFLDEISDSALHFNISRNVLIDKTILIYRVLGYIHSQVHFQIELGNGSIASPILSGTRFCNLV